MLTLTVKGSERDVFIPRKVYPTVPLKVAHELAPLGQTFVLPLENLLIWARETEPSAFRRSSETAHGHFCRSL